VTAGNANGLWTSGAGGTLTNVARSGTSGTGGPNLGPGVEFLGNFFFDTRVNDAGAVAFWAVLTGSTDNEGVFTTAGGAMHAVAREGDAAPGTSAGVAFGGFINQSVSLNNAGDVAFLAALKGAGIGTTNRDGIWSTAGGQLVKVVREGDSFDVDPGPATDLRVISDIEFGNTFVPTRLTEDGRLAFELTFTDGTSGVFTAVVPEPTGIGALSTAGAAALLVRRRRRASLT
jgi:hypothetical protein